MKTDNQNVSSSQNIKIQRAFYFDLLKTLLLNNE
jgi:hypothetical protein